LRGTVAKLAEAGIRVSLFIAAEPAQIEAAAALGAPVIEIHTGAWCDALAAGEAAAATAEFARIMRQLEEYATWLVDEARARPFEVLACEQRIEVPLGDVALVGRVDRIDRLTDGSLVVRDYKSGRLRGKNCGKALAAALAQIAPGRPGLGLFGNAPDGLKLQTFLYVRGVEALFGGRVSRADYIYLAGEAQKSDETCIDSVELDDDARRDLDVVYDVISVGVAREISGGDLTAFPTAIDEKTCRYCHFTAICPGPGTRNYSHNTIAHDLPNQLSLDLSNGEPPAQ